MHDDSGKLHLDGNSNIKIPGLFLEELSSSEFTKVLGISEHQTLAQNTDSKKDQSLVQNTNSEEDQMLVESTISEAPIVHQCEVCGHGFKHASWLRQHQSWHSCRPVTSPALNDLINHSTIENNLDSSAINNIPTKIRRKLTRKSQMIVENTGKVTDKKNLEKTGDFSASLTRLTPRRRRGTNPAEPNQPRCSVCGRTFQRRHQLRRHHARAHAGVPPHPCPDCPARFKLRGRSPGPTRYPPTGGCPATFAVCDTPSRGPCPNTGGSVYPLRMKKPRINFSVRRARGGLGRRSSCCITRGCTRASGRTLARCAMHAS